ncbi:flagellar biosynthetic protein FliO [Bacillus cihuensis]|uniref:flagellar biosynthetic protein FliO n=1 Tax=Bacillus cihuensis TaxID=1208599 RepID=UPI000422AE61|nr:flagellar biosynthetic protein FliO [Bacillus cihuensis]
MFSVKKWIAVLVIIVFGMISFQGHTFADELSNQTVKDAYSKPEKPNDTNEAEKALKQKDNTKIESSTSKGLSILDFVRVAAAIIFVVILLYGLLWFMNKRNKAFQKANFVENLGGTTLGSNRSVQIVKVGRRILVVGVGENISLLKEIDNQEEYEEVIQNHNEKMDNMMVPRDIVAKMRDKWGEKENKFDDFSSQLNKQLKELEKTRKKAIGELNKKERDLNE